MAARSYSSEKRLEPHIPFCGVCCSANSREINGPELNTPTRRSLHNNTLETGLDIGIEFPRFGSPRLSGALRNSLQSSSGLSVIHTRNSPQLLDAFR
eukprot:14109485-Alexandrium_andersonii.AAC.1